jgi:HPr kinase/phosphorylase
MVAPLERKGWVTCACGKSGLERYLTFPRVGPLKGESLLLYDYPNRAIAIFSSSPGAGDEGKSLTVFASFVDMAYLKWRLELISSELSSGFKMIHGNLVEVFGQGILITGPSGAGKSLCSWALLEKGHRLIADDVVVLRRNPEGKLSGRAHGRIRGYMHLRGEGIFKLEDEHIAEEAIVRWHIKLAETRVGGHRFNIFCGVRIPQIELAYTDRRELAATIEELFT